MHLQNSTESTAEAHGGVCNYLVTKKNQWISLNDGLMVVFLFNFVGSPNGFQLISWAPQMSDLIPEIKLIAVINTHPLRNVVLQNQMEIHPVVWCKVVD